MGGQHQTGHLPNEDQKLDSLRPGSTEVERGRWEGQNFQLKEVQRLEEEEAVTVWQIPDPVDTVVCAPDDGWTYHPKHVEQFPDINKMYNVASCWIYRVSINYFPVYKHLLQENFVEYQKMHMLKCTKVL